MKRLDLHPAMPDARPPWWLPGRLHLWMSEDAWRGTKSAGGRVLFARLGRVLHLLITGFRVDRCSLRAGSLTFLTVLSLVPSLAFACAVLKGLGAYALLRDDIITPWLDDLLGAASATPDEPVAKLRDSLDAILRLVEETDFRSLGLVGLAFLIFAVVKMLGGVEGAFNAIWNAERARSPLRQVADYVSLSVVSPILLVASVGLTAQAHGTETVARMLQLPYLGPVLESFFAILPFVLLWLGFSLLYLLLPNARTRVRSSLLGGAVAAILWHYMQLGHVQFQLSMAGYNKVYSGFAAVPIFFVWVQLSWMAVMIGAELAWALQHEPGLRRVLRVHPDDHAFREVQAVRAAARVAARFLSGGEPWSLGSLARDLDVSEPWLEELVGQLQAGGVLALSGGEGEDALLLPARDPNATRLVDVLTALRGPTAVTDVPPQTALDDRLAESLQALGLASAGAAANSSLAALVLD